jgi:cobalt-zinc-cadmium efflux system membrane fusion protein
MIHRGTSGRSVVFLTVVAATAAACRNNTAGKRDEAPHRHDHEAAGQGKGEPEIPSLSVTLYQSGLELFMEYPAFVVGKPSPLVAHFTDARDANGFKVVTKGRVTAVLRHADGKEERFVADKLLRDGIFKPVVTPTRAGEGTLTLRLEGEQVAGTVEVGKVTVFASPAAAIAAAAQEQESAAPTVPFLKEQQWKTRYATALATVRVLQGAVRANGEIKPVAGQSAELATPVAGVIPVGGPVPHLGQRVKKGELLLHLAPTTVVSGTTLASVDLELSRARSELGLAQRDLTRAQELFAAQAIPEKQIDAARAAQQVAAARVQAAERERGLYRSAQAPAGGRGRATFELRSPLDGVIAFAEITPGAVVEAGSRLVSVVNTERLWLEAKVYESDAPRVEKSSGASFTVAGFDSEFVIDDTNGKRIAVGAVVDRVTRTVPVIFEFVNPDGRLKPGMFAKVDLLTGETLRGVAVPESAIVDDNGRPVVFAMEDGESFHKRVVRPGVRSGGLIQILEGVKEGERVVSQGAYEIKLSTATGAMLEHGHQH